MYCAYIDACVECISLVHKYTNLRIQLFCGETNSNEFDYATECIMKFVVKILLVVTNFSNNRHKIYAHTIYLCLGILKFGNNNTRSVFRRVILLVINCNRTFESFITHNVSDGILSLLLISADIYIFFNSLQYFKRDVRL